MVDRRYQGAYLSNRTSLQGLTWLAILTVAGLWTVFAVQSLSAPGDQDWFREMAGFYKYDYLAFAMDRYQTWSSRFLIEAATAFFSVHVPAFLVVVFTSTVLLLWMMIKEMKHHLFNPDYAICIPLLFLLLFDKRLFISAGIVANMSNYYLPMVTFLLAFFLRKQKGFSPFLGVLSLVFAVMNEQFALLTVAVVCYSLWTGWDRRPVIDMTYLLIGLGGLVSIFLCPGNAIRKTAEMKTFYPSFEQVSLLKKVQMVFLDTNNSLFTKELSGIYLFCCLLLLVAICHKKWFLVFLSSLLLMVTTLGLPVLKNTTWFINQVKEAHTIDPTAIHSIRYTLLYVGILALIALVVYMIFDNKKKAMFALYLLIVGYATRMALVLSPTMFASEERTLISFFTSLFIVCLLLMTELPSYVTIRKKPIS